MGSAGDFAIELSRLTAEFERSDWQADDTDEAALRNDFLNPLWTALGWDLTNRQRLPQTLREVAIEPRVHVRGRKKRADYVFRVNGLPRFVGEAKP